MEHGSFTANVPRLMELLSESLYPDPLACVREIVANAIDASLVCGLDEGIEVVLDPGKSLTVVDRGVGITPETVAQTLGTIADSAKHGLEELRSAQIAPTGVFGVGLFAVMTAACELVIDSHTGRDGLTWRWAGGKNYAWRRTPPGSRGTRVRIGIKPLSVLAELDIDRLRGYLATNFAFAPVEIMLETASSEDRETVNSPAPPWRSDAQAEDWGQQLGLGFLVGGSIKHRRRPGGGAAAFVPDADGAAAPAPQVYRSGVRLLGGEGIVAEEFRWLSLYLDLPGAPTDLAKRSFAGPRFDELRAEVELLLDELFREVIARLAQERPSPAWWARRRKELVRTLARQLGRQRLTATERSTLASFLPFGTRRGPMTIAEIARRPRSEGELQVDFASPSDERLFEWLREGSGLRTHTRGKGVGAPERHAGIRELRTKLDAALAPLGVTVRASDSPGLPGVLANWESPPTWALDDVLGREGRARRRSRGAVLLLNAASSLVDQIGRELDDHSVRAAGFLLVEWATAHARGDRVAAEQIGEALFRLIGELSPPPIGHDRARVFVAHDWTYATAVLGAVREVLGQEPFGYDVLRASDESQDGFVLNNVRKMMLSCHVLVSVLTSRPDPHPHVSTSVLMEAGMASTLRSRPHFLCVHRDVVLPTNFKGFIRIEFSTLSELSDKLRVEANKLGLRRTSL